MRTDMISTPSLALLSLVSAFPLAATEVHRCIDFVDPFIGTEYSGNVFPGPTRPFGLVQPGPDSGHGSGRYAAGYKHLEETIYGFSQTHLSGMGCGDLGDVLLLPYTGDDPAGTNRFCGAKDRFRETAKVGYYSVALTNFGVTAEVAASHRVGFHRWTYPKGSVPKALVDLQWACYDPGPAPQLRDGNANKYVLDYAGRLGDDSRTITGRRVTDGWMRGRTVAWHLQFSRPWTKARWENDPNGGKAGRYVLEFAEDAVPLECRVAISSCDEEGAKRNFDAEANVTFDRAVADTQGAWEKLLSRASFESKDSNKLRILYTGLYHADVQPIDMSDVDGRYRGGDRRIAKSTNPDGAFYSNFSTWDTFRSVQAMYALLVPERVDGMVDSMLAHYKATGCLPIHVDFGIENHCMVAVHSVPLITESYLKGFRGFDAELALEAVTNSLTVLHEGYPRENWDLLNMYGYIPFDKVFNQSASRTLEVAYDDACVEKMARAMGRDEVAGFFGRRAYAWTNLFDRSVGFIRGKDSSGNWRHPFDPDKTGYVSHPQFDFTEGSSWTYTWHVMQHPELLIEMLGGKDAAGEKLEAFFSKPGRYDHGNEPGHHIAYFFQYAGRPWSAEKVLRRVSSTYHYATDDGITGNDDCGQVSCWYMFTALGFYPFDPSSCTYVIGAPQIDRAELKLANGKTFTMVARGLSDRAKYVKGVRLNGKPLEGFLLKHADIMAGGFLEFEMSAVPSGGLPGVANEQLPLSTWSAPLKCQPEPVNFLPCFRDWKNQPVDRARWEEIVRKWTHDAFEGGIYGVRPVRRPSDLQFEIVGTDETAVPAAVRKTVRITYGGPCGRDSFEATAFIPKSPKPVGAFLLICNRDPSENLDVTRAKKTEFWPVEEIVRRGYAAVAFHNEQLCPDRADYAFDQKVHRVYSPQGRSARSWGAISAWAWGASRVMDWLETVPEIDAKCVAVVGHSRGGKTSFWAAADDTRFAMACVNDSGAGGAKMNRMRPPDAENVAVVNIHNPHWFTVGWQRMNYREDEWGLDAHDLAALVAPRLLAIGSASEDYGAGPVGEFATAKYGSLAWEKYGLKGIRDRSFPAPGEVVANGNVSYHLRVGRHGLTLWDWNRYMDFADAHGWSRAR